MDEKRTYHDTDAPYTLPNDAPEHTRLELQSLAINRMMSNQPVRAPLDSPARLIDIGCGTGIMTSYLAQTYPKAKNVIGIDLSPVPLRDSESRATFIQGDFRQISGTPDCPQLAPHSFDYAFSRMLVCGMTDWPAYIAQVKRLLRSGGWAEFQDLDFNFYDQDQHPLSGTWSWFEDQRKALARKGLDIRVGSKIEQYVREAGFVDIEVKTYRWIYGQWKGHPETDMMGAYCEKYLVPTKIAMYRKVLDGIKFPEEIEEDVARMKTDLDCSENGKHQKFFVVIGRQP